ncbi:hypothetical protein D3C71_1229700 [compost metagenome]
MEHDRVIVAGRIDVVLSHPAGGGVQSAQEHEQMCLVLLLILQTNSHSLHGLFKCGSRFLPGSLRIRDIAERVIGDAAARFPEEADPALQRIQQRSVIGDRLPACIA